MKKVAFIRLGTLSKKLSNRELKNVLGGYGGYGGYDWGDENGYGDGIGGCSVRCDQNKTVEEAPSVPVPDCSRASCEAVCGADLSKTVCGCS
jgi:hypothetical protein